MEELKFLLIEEAHEDAELIQQQLKKEFTFSIQIITSREAFTNSLRNFKPDVILSGLYNKNREDFWPLNIRNKIIPDVPFIVMTPTFKDEIAIDCLEGGATNYLSKEHLVRLNFVIKMALNQIALAEQNMAAEKDLAESLEHFKRFVDHDISGDYLENENEVLYCNRKVLEIFEFESLQELNSFGTSNLYENPKDREKLNQDLKTGKKVENREFRMFTKNGRPIVVLENAYADFDEEGNIVTMYGYLIDITEQRHSEDLLQASENLFRTLMESTSAGIIIYDQEHFLFTNPAVSNLLGYSREELLKMNYWDVVHPDHRDIIKERGHQRINKESVSSHYQFKIITKSGETKWIDYTAAQTMYQEKIAAIGTLYDITKQKNDAVEIKKLSTVIEQNPLSVVITD
ncbi:MAG: PAS domain S-box protein [Bacteroidales bacterium]|nr:PAS domain S-box protein [Bacteroidales bacterium]